jgi:Zn-dependent protease
MISMLYAGQIALFLLIVSALVISLSFHEWGHAFAAKMFGDDTAQRAGRLTLNPLAHLDPIGLLMVVMVGFGWAKPVPTNPRNFTSRWADLVVSAAGPGMNLIIAFIGINAYIIGLRLDVEFMQGPGIRTFIFYLTTINLILMIFNLIPLGALDGHYILPYFLTPRAAATYVRFNAQYGNMALVGLMLLSFAGIPVFRFILQIGQAILPYLVVT